jgi:hypothetical protein
MFRVDHPSGIATLVPPTPVRLRPYGGYFARGDARMGTEGTIIDAEWLNMLQEELCNVVTLNTTAALDKSDRTQLLQVIEEIAPGGGGGGGTGGAQISEPIDDDFANSRTNPIGADPAPPETGSWIHALKEPPANPPNTAYSRARMSGVADGVWVVAAGREVVDSDEPRQLHVDKRTDTETGSGTEDDPFKSIQAAIDYACTNIDAAGVGVDILVGTHILGADTTMWDGFEVTQRITNCPPDGLRVISKAANPDACQIKGGVFGGRGARACVYVNGGRVGIGGFSFFQPDGGALGQRGVAIFCEGSGSICTIERPVIFHTIPSTQDHLWANASGIIRVNANYTIETGAAGQNHHMHASNHGMIIYMENFLVTFVGAGTFVHFVMGETGGILLLRYSWRYTGVTLAAGPMNKYYICGGALIDMSPMYTTYTGGTPAVPAPTQVVNLIPGLSPTGNVTTGAKRVPPLSGY